ncbi:Hsp20/alpha crystallin family protein [Saccharicrinis sp. FJH54]|uniref:Hsp20/alpha crystallin family protein n=1 Tax=Saccharicrinis sp. FJH54 TaxID=3344665 RepID=UPI0035D4A974
MTLVRFNNNPVRASFPDFFSDVMENMFNSNEMDTPAFTKPLCNVMEDKEGFSIEFALPGFSKNDVTIDVDNNVLTVAGKKEENKKDKEQNYTRREFSYGEFKRSFTLPETVDQDKIKATFSDGILNVEIPKKPELQPKSLKININ